MGYWVDVGEEEMEDWWIMLMGVVVGGRWGEGGVGRRGGEGGRRGGEGGG